LNGGLHLVILEGKSMLNTSYDVDDARRRIMSRWRGVGGGLDWTPHTQTNWYLDPAFPPHILSYALRQ
jgi:hypothetical protein